MEYTLSLKEFIKEALIEINSAVTEAADEGVSIVYNKYESGQHPRIQTVNFDLAVTIEKSSEKKDTKNGGLGISVLNVRMDKKKNDISIVKNTNRLNFSVDVFLGLKEPLS